MRKRGEEHRGDTPRGSDLGFALYEIEGGTLKLTMNPRMRPIEDYLKAQNR